MRRWLNDNWFIIGFVILVAFAFFGLTKLNDVNSHVSRVAKAASYDNCQGINKAYAAVRYSDANTGTVLVNEIQALKKRLLQAHKLNPPKTAREEASFQSGLKYFDGLISDTKMLTTEARIKVEGYTQPLGCQGILRK